MEIGIKKHVFFCFCFSNTYLQSVNRLFPVLCVNIRPVKFTLHMSGCLPYREKDRSRQPDFFVCGSWSIIVLSFLFFLESLCIWCPSWLECSSLFLIPSPSQLTISHLSVSHTEINFLGEAFLDLKDCVRSPIAHCFCLFFSFPHEFLIFGLNRNYHKIFLCSKLANITD